MIPHALQPFIDEENKLAMWPKKPVKKQLAVEYMASFFEKGKTYTEHEVNEILKSNSTFGDHVLLRRELFNRHLMNRTLDGREYTLA